MTVYIVLFHPQVSIRHIRTHTGPQKSTRASICKQAGCKGFHVSGRDLTAIEPHFNQGPRVAHTGLLCTDRRRVCKTIVAPIANIVMNGGGWGGGGGGLCTYK